MLIGAALIEHISIFLQLLRSSTFLKSFQIWKFSISLDSSYVFPKRSWFIVLCIWVTAEPMRLKPCLVLAKWGAAHLTLGLTSNENTYFQASCALLQECPEKPMISTVIENCPILLGERYWFAMQYREPSTYFAKSGFKRLFSTKQVLYKYKIFLLCENLTTVCVWSRRHWGQNSWITFSELTAKTFFPKKQPEKLFLHAQRLSTSRKINECMVDCRISSLFSGNFVSFSKSSIFEQMSPAGPMQYWIIFRWNFVPNRL